MFLRPFFFNDDNSTDCKGWSSHLKFNDDYIRQKFMSR